jgi:hypothetical protein
MAASFQVSLLAAPGLVESEPESFVRELYLVTHLDSAAKES